MNLNPKEPTSEQKQYVPICTANIIEKPNAEMIERKYSYMKEHNIVQAAPKSIFNKYTFIAVTKE